MDRQYYTLMEAYYKVYDEVEQLDEVSAQTAMKASKAADDKANGMSHNGDHNGASKKRKQAVNLYQKALARAKNKTQANESVDNYDLIMSYLLDEGFADTEADAEVIMANMSEEWLEDILEGFKPTNYNQGPDIFKGRGKKAQQLDRQIAKHKKEGNVVKSMNMDFINRMMDDPESRKESMEKSRRNRMKSDARARRDAQQDVKKYGLS
jgi:hypothetical protein